MAETRPSNLRLACGYIQVPRIRDGETLVSRGTAYLVAPDLAVTCAHVVQSRHGVQDDPNAGAITVQFDGTEATATIESIDTAADCAVVRLGRELSLPTLTLAASAPPDMVRCDGWGVTLGDASEGPASHESLEGVVVAPHATDSHGQARITLIASDLADRVSQPGNALAGSPVLVDGEVVGHVCEAVLYPNSVTRPLAGLVSAVPAGVVREALKMDSWPARSANPYHAYLSIREADRAWAEDLQEFLEQSGFRLYLASHEMVKGAELGPVEQEALEGARAALLVYSAAWENDDSHLKDTEVLRSDRFDTVIVQLDDVPLHASYSSYPTFAFTSDEAPKDPELARLKNRLLGVAVNQFEADADVWRTIERSTARLATEIKDSDGSPESTLMLAQRWQRAGMPGEYGPRRAAQELVRDGRPDLALQILDGLGKSPRIARLRALALSRDGQNDEAVRLLEDLREKGQLDGRTGAILAGRYKQKWLDTGQRRRSLLRKSLDAYAETYRLQPRPYRGINVATMARLAGDEERSRAVADEVIRALSESSKLSGWDKATMGEACLLKKDFDGAASWYEEATLHDPDATGNISTMRKQARLILSSFDADAKDARARIEEALYIPGVAGFVGERLTGAEGSGLEPHRERFFRRRVREIVREHDVVFGLCSLTDGCDLLFAEAVLEYGGEIEALLPFAPVEFRDQLVDPLWRSRFDAVVANRRSAVSTFAEWVPTADELGGVIASATEALIDRVMARAAAIDQDPLFITVSAPAEYPKRRGALARRAWIDEGRKDRLVNIKVGREPAAEGQQDKPDGSGDKEEGPVAEPDPALTPQVDPDTRSQAETRTIGSGSSGRATSLEEGRYRQRHCLAIGIDAYDELKPLKNAVADATGFAAEMRTHFGFTSPSLLMNKNATGQAIKEAIVDEMSKNVGEDDLFVLFFAGHGQTLTKAGRDFGYLAPVETARNKEAALLNLSEVLGWVAQLKCRHVLYIFDSCFSGRATMGLGINIEARPNDARQSITAGTASQLVLDGGADGHSVFTAALLEGLQGAVLRRADGRFSALDLYSYVADTVRERTNKTQTPSRGDLPGHGGGRIWFGG